MKVNRPVKLENQIMDLLEYFREGIYPNRYYCIRHILKVININPRKYTSPCELSACLTKLAVNGEIDSNKGFIRMAVK